ncbi:N-6 DNA methylase [Caloramator sp. mosi_1]|nr:N-6 DNA methylase [Caloramator sp. mosi_1]WDC85028.1 N-6 DNA methylase [Caloramator sp. mosi_1]
MSISTIIKSIQDIMRQDSGVDGDAQRIGQLVWMIFLKVFDAKEQEWEILKDEYTPIIPEGLRWRDWAENPEGITGDELIDFVNNRLFKELKEMELDENSDPKAFIVKAVFEDSYNYMKSGTLMRQVINKLNEIDFTTQHDRHLFNDIYETILKDLQSAGKSGEYYTPRALTDFIIECLNPKIGEKVADFACGTGGFLVSALKHIEKDIKTVEDREIFQNTLFGIEKNLFHIFFV